MEFILVSIRSKVFTKYQICNSDSLFIQDRDSSILGEDGNVENIAAQLNRQKYISSRQKTKSITVKHQIIQFFT